MTAQLSFGSYDVNLAANKTQLLPVLGSVFKVLSATGAVSIRIDGGPAQKFVAGQGVDLRGGQTFSKLEITDLTGAGNTVSLFVAVDALFLDQTFSGSVSISNVRISADDSVTAAASLGKTFTVSHGGNVPNGPGSYVYEFANPGGSGVNAFFRDWVVSAAAKTTLSAIVQKYSTYATFPAGAAVVPDAAAYASVSAVLAADGAALASLTGLGTLKNIRDAIDGADFIEQTARIDLSGMVLLPGQAVRLVIQNSSVGAPVAMRSTIRWFER